MHPMLEIQEFFVEGSSQERSHVLLHIAEPVTPSEKEKGYFFALVEINDGYTEQISQIQKIIDEIESSFYDEHARGKNLFEEILQKANRQSHHVLQYTGSSVHCIVGALKETDLTIAYHGKPTAMLFFDGKDGLEETLVIDRSMSNGNEQLFSEVIEGSMGQGDYIYFATPHVEDYFSSDRVRKILFGRTTRQSAGHMQKVLGDLKEEKSFGGILFHIADNLTVSKTGKRPRDLSEGSEKSLNSLMATAKTTEQTLSPPLFSHLTKKIKERWIARRQRRQEDDATRRITSTIHETKVMQQARVETNYRPSPRQHEEQETTTGKILVAIGHALVFVVTGIFYVFKKIVMGGIQVCTTLFFLATNMHGKRTLVIDSWQAKLNERKSKIKHLGLISKILFVAILTLGVIFIASIIYLKIKANRTAQLAQYETMIQTITDKKNDAEARLLYGEDNKALNIINETKNLINALPNGSKEEKAKVQDLNNQVEIVVAKLRKVSNVNAELIADLSQKNPQAAATGLTLFENTVIVFGPTDSLLYRVNPTAKTIEAQPHETVKGLIAGNVPKELDGILFVTNQNALLQYAKDTHAFTSETITYPYDDITIKSLFVYSRRLYTLDPKHATIYKHSPTQTGYDKGVEWLKQADQQLSQAVSIAIDGDLFAATTEGKILKYTSGEPQPFTITGLDPALVNPSLIWTYYNVDRIYILEPANKRVIIINKDGKFLGQYISDQWKNPTGMAVDDMAKVIYVLDQNKVYKFSF